MGLEAGALWVGELNLCLSYKMKRAHFCPFICNFGTYQMLLEVVLHLPSFGRRGLSEQLTKCLAQLCSDIHCLQATSKNDFS